MTTIAFCVYTVNCVFAIPQIRIRTKITECMAAICPATITVIWIEAGIMLSATAHPTYSILVASQGKDIEILFHKVLRQICSVYIQQLNQGFFEVESGASIFFEHFQHIERLYLLLACVSLSTHTADLVKITGSPGKVNH